MSTGGAIAAAAGEARIRPVPVAAGRRRTVFVLVAVLAVLNFADLVTTRMVLDRGGAEGNPVMRPFVEGVWAAAGIKLTCVALIAVLASRCVASARIRWGLALVDGWYAVVVVWNLAVLARA
jgi:hypothetical protein